MCSPLADWAGNVTLDLGTSRDRAFAAGWVPTKVREDPSRPVADRQHPYERFIPRAPPFGMVHLQPARMCAVAEHIGGNVALAARTKAYCTRMPQVFEK